MLQTWHAYATKMSDGLTMLVAGAAVLAARVVGLPPTAVNMGVAGVFMLAGLIVVQGRRIQTRNKARGESVVRWGFWLFSLAAGVFVAHNTLGTLPS